MKTSDIMKIFGLQVYSDKVLHTDQDILRVIESCKRLTDSMRVDMKDRKNAQGGK